MQHQAVWFNFSSGVGERASSILKAEDDTLAILLSVVFINSSRHMLW
jgi:hypothetical protein